MKGEHGGARVIVLEGRFGGQRAVFMARPATP
jgi:hypothetical protein